MSVWIKDLPTILCVFICSPSSATSKMRRRKLRLSLRVSELRVDPIGSRMTVLDRTMAFQSSFLLLRMIA